MSDAPATGELLTRLTAVEAGLTQANLLIVALQAENAELRRQLVQDSRNSSKPPSSDSPFAKPAPRSLRRRTGRKPGGQPGHPGERLRQVVDPEEVVVHEPHVCRCCGLGLDGRPVSALTRRQLFDIPPVAVKVSEHQLVERECVCGVRTRADAPAGVDAPVRYGPRIAAIIVYLYVGQFLSKKRTAQALAELFGTPVSEGTVTVMAARAGDGLDGFLELVRARIAAAPVAHFDETGLRVQGKLRWVHSASTGKYSLITVHDRRGIIAMNAAGVLPSFTGVAVHDAWAPYDAPKYYYYRTSELAESLRHAGSNTEWRDPPRTTANQLASYQRRYRKLAAQLADIGYIVAGSLAQRPNRCGKPNCRCHADPPQLDGPYWQGTAKVNAKTVNRRLTQREAELSQEWIDNDRRQRAVIAKMREVAATATALMLKRTHDGSTEV